MLSFLVRWCLDHGQHTRLCPVLRFWNPDQITFDILDSPTHFSHNNSHTPSAPYLLEVPVHRTSIARPILQHGLTDHILPLQCPSNKKYKNAYYHSANPALPLVPCSLPAPHYPDIHTDQKLLRSHPVPLPAVLCSFSLDTLLP